MPPDASIRFLDPAFGTGAFYSALLRTFGFDRIANATGYEIDGEYAETAKLLCRGMPLDIHVRDFTHAAPPSENAARANLLICNPPYVRHHHLSPEEKNRLQRLVRTKTGFRLNGLSGLYCYFMCLSSAWMARDGLAGWLVPSEFMDVNYGREVKRYLLEQVELLRVHVFEAEDVQFEDALVSSAIVWFWNRKPGKGHLVEIACGGTFESPRRIARVSIEELAHVLKWRRVAKGSPAADHASQGSRLGDLFEIKRGIATGHNSFFVLTEEQVREQRLPARFLMPILPSPRYLPGDEIAADRTGKPLIKPRLYLLSCDLPEAQVRAEYPTLWQYLKQGTHGISTRYLCRHRSPWYAQEIRPPAPFLCRYMARLPRSGNRPPFRFILNHSKATAPNVYLMLYPRAALRRLLDSDSKLATLVWQALNEIPTQVLLGEGRVYGGGLYKLEPRELANTPADTVMAALPDPVPGRATQTLLFR
jgi:hypothetical protein